MLLPGYEYTIRAYSSRRHVRATNAIVDVVPPIGYGRCDSNRGGQEIIEVYYIRLQSAVFGLSSRWPQMNWIQFDSCAVRLSPSRPQVKVKMKKRWGSLSSAVLPQGSPLQRPRAHSHLLHHHVRYPKNSALSCDSLTAVVSRRVGERSLIEAG